MAQKLGLLREVLGYEIRRLARGRRRAAPASPVPARRARSASPVRAERPAPVDEWAVAVLDHAERVMAGGAGRGRTAMPGVTAFEVLDLGLVPDAVAHLVRARGRVVERELVDLLAAELELGALAPEHHHLLGALVWSAKERRLIAPRDGWWVPGDADADADAGVIEALEGRCLDGLAVLAGELREHDTSDDAILGAVLDEVVGEGERAPRIVATAVGAGIALARRRGELDHDRWGQAHLELESRE